MVAPSPHGAARPTARTIWALGLLTLIFAFSQLDRGIVAIVLDSIKAEMQLSDAMLGLLTGLGFTVVYVIAAFPLGHLADRGNRVRIVSAGIVFYSIMAALMGAAQNVWQMIAARSAVAVGEASGSAASTSLIADFFPLRTRTRANSIWSAGSYLGLFIGLTTGGWLHAHYGWRVALWATALPGVVVGGLFLLTVPEPERGAADEQHIEQSEVTLGETIRFLLAQRSFGFVLAAMTCAGITNYSMQAWLPSVLHRVHRMGPAEIGFYAGLFKGLVGLAGILAGGFISQMLARERLGKLATVPVISCALVPFAFALFLWIDDTGLSLIALGFGSFLSPMFHASAVSMIQSMARPRMRAMAVTIIFSIVLLIGLGIGPAVTGLVSDLLMPTYGADSLRLALIGPAMLQFLASILFWRAGRAIEADAQRTFRAP